jgi:Leucine-rich repeat (LRR) protein
LEPSLPIARLTNLCKLEFVNLLSITDLPGDLWHLSDNLWQLPDLRELIAVNCSNLDHIPADIPADAKLESLRLSGGKIARLPNSLCALSNLTCLSIGCCETEALPDDFSRLTSLRILHFDGALRLPLNMERLVNLEEVHLAGQRLDVGGAFSKPMPSM